MSVNDVIEQPQITRFDKTTKVFFFSILILVLYVGYDKYNDYKSEQENTLVIISEPKISDIYFLDYRLLSEDLRPHEKYRIAKVVDVTGDIVTLLYGSFFYQHKHATLNSIKYGQLTFKNYFEPKRYDIPIDTVKTMQNEGAIYLARRPVQGKLYGNKVGYDKFQFASSLYIYGKRENIKGEAFLRERYSETNLKSAFDLFQESSKLGYSEGQINLAKMYINGFSIEKDLDKALYWLNQASLQSSKPAILKYGIICKQVSGCNIYDFYKNLSDSGVSIKVRELDFQL